MRFAGLGIVGCLLVHLAGPPSDATRNLRAIDQAMLLVPDGKQLSTFSFGFAEPIADLLWVRTVLTFGERFETDSSAQWVAWMQRMVETVSILDPVWRTPYFYGGSLLRVLGAIDASDAVFIRASEHLPDDPFFPFSIGMNAYLYRDDAGAAADWIGRAARLPSAPAWYIAAAAAMRSRSGNLDLAVLDLERTLAGDESPEIKADAKRQLDRLQQARLVDGWREECKAFREREGRPLSSPRELEALLGHPLPPNPRGDAWVVGNDGIVRSEGAERERHRRARMGEMGLAGAR